jgi:hypothetical protein
MLHCVEIEIILGAAIVIHHDQTQGFPSIQLIPSYIPIQPALTAFTYVIRIGKIYHIQEAEPTNSNIIQ